MVSALSALGTVLDLISGPIQTATFNLFIFEEALQTAGMGAYMANGAKDWDELERQTEVMEKILAAAEAAYKINRTIIHVVVIATGAPEMIDNFLYITGLAQKDAIVEYFLAPYRSFFDATAQSIAVYKAKAAAEKAWTPTTAAPAETAW